MTERILRARFEGDSSGLKRMAQEGKQAIDSIVDAQEKASREWTDIVREAETEATSVVKQGTERRASEVEKGERRAGDAVSREAKRRLDTIQREVNETIKAIEKLPISREEKERQVARVVENGAKKASQIVQQELRRQEQAYQQAAKSGLDYGAALDEIGRRVLALASAYASLQTLLRGIEYNSQLETLSLGVASIVSANQEITNAQGQQIEGAEKLAIVQGQVAQVFKDLKQDAINTTATLPQLVESFNAAVGPAMAMGLSLDETRALTVQLVQTMGAMGIPLNQSRQEIQSILQGTIDNNSVLAKNLGITNDQVKAWAQQGTLVQSLLEKTKDFGAAGKLAGETWDGVTSTMQENWDTFLGKVTSAPAELLKQAMKGANEALEGELGDRLDDLAILFGDNMYNALLGILPVAQTFGEILLIGAEKTNQVLGGVAAMSANAGANKARVDMMRQGIGDIKGLNPVQRTALQATAHHSLDDLLLTSKTLRVSDAAQGELKQLYERTQKMAEKAADEQFIESYGNRVDSIVAGMQPKHTIKTKGGGTGGGGDKSKPLEGHQLLAAQHKAGDLSDEQYLARLNVELGKVVKNSSDYFAIREKIAGLKSDPWLDKIFEQSPGALDLRLGQHIQGNFGASLPITTLADRIGGAFETPTAMLGLGDPGAPAKAELFGPGYGKAYDEFLKREAAKLQKLAEDADKALQSGLEAGLSAFLDGGIGNLGEATYSLSKDAFSKALVDGVMSSEVKDAVGALGESLGAALQHPVTAAIAVAAMGLYEIKKAFDQVQQHNRTLDGWKEQYLNPRSQQQKDVEQWRKERDAYQREADRDVGLVEALMGFGHVKAEARKKVEVYDDLIAAVEAQNQLADAAYAAAQALDGVARRGEVVSNSVSGTELMMKLAGIESGTADYDAGVVNAYRSGLNNAGFDIDFADRLVGDRDLQKTIVSEYRGWSQDGFGTETSRDDWLVSQFGGRFEGDALRQLLESTILPMFSRLADINPTTQSVGSLSNPDHALRLDAPVNRVNNFQNQVVINTYAITGDKASFRDLVVEIMAEANTVQGQSV